MAKPYVLANEIQSTLAVAWTRGTSTAMTLVDGTGFPSGGGYVRVGDDTSFALMECTGRTGDDQLDHAAAGYCTLGVVVSVGDETKEWPIGTVVARVWMAEEAAELITGPASATDGQVFLADGTTGKKAKLATLDNTVTHALFATAGAPAFRAIAQTDLGAFVTQAATTLYVAKTGNDSNAGTAGSPKLTIGGALDAIPVVLAHACVINVAPGEYDEILSTKLAKFVVPASLVIEAKDTADRVWHVNGTATAGAATTIDVENAHVVSDDEWNGAYITIYDGTGNGQIRAITDTDAANNRLTVATWDTNPDSTSKYILWGAVRIDGESAAPVSMTAASNMTFAGIGFKVSAASTQVFYANASRGIQLTECGTLGNAYGFYFVKASSIGLTRCSCLVPASGYGVWCISKSFASMVSSVIYGAKSSDVGIFTYQGSMVAGQNCVVRHLATGLSAGAAAMIMGSFTHTDNTTNANPVHATTVAEIVTQLYAFIEDVS